MKEVALVVVELPARVKDTCVTATVICYRSSPACYKVQPPRAVIPRKYVPFVAYYKKMG